MGLDDREAMSVLRDAVTSVRDGDELVDGPRARGTTPLAEPADELVAAFYTRWFAADPTVRDMFPPDMTAQRRIFGQALDWLLGEFIAQHADKPVAFLAQLGRDHRKYGVTAAHYESMSHALYVTLRARLGVRWTPAVEDAARQTLNLMIGVMSGAAEAEQGPAWWEGTVADYQRVSRDLAVVRLFLDTPMQYHAGQYVKVEVPQLLRRWRDLSPAIPAQPDGGVEFHIRRVAGGMVSRAIVEETALGDRWRLSAPLGALRVDRDAGDVLMVAGSTGLAPLRAIIMDLARFGDCPRVHLFFGARYPCELYDLRTLWQLAANCPWLSVTPVAEFPEPVWATDYPDVQPPRGLHVLQRGRLPEVVTRYGGWGDRQILLSGSAGMIAATKAELIAKGTDPQRIQHDPV